MKNLSITILPLVALLSLAPNTLAQGITPFTNGEVADADDVNANFNFLEQARVAQSQTIADLTARIDTLEALLTAQNQALLGELLPTMSVVEMDQLDDTTATTVRFTGVNVQIMNNGGGTTSTDGTGNLILGHAETSSPDGAALGARTGSHNLVLGVGNAYTAHSGIIAGYGNFGSGQYASILSGHGNRAEGSQSIIGSGAFNTALGEQSVVVSGNDNEAIGYRSVAVSGRFSRPSGENSVVVAGRENRTSGLYSAVMGGFTNQATQSNSIICGGSFNLASGDQSLVVGGSGNQATALRAVTVGGVNNKSENTGTTVVGGEGNRANGVFSTIGGGKDRSTAAIHDWTAGGLFQDN